MAYEIIEEEHTTFVFPIIRRVHMKPIMQDLVSIQPMQTSSALIFYMDYMYDSEFSIEQDMKTADEEIQKVKEIIVKWIKQSNRIEHLKKVIYEKYPQYREMLDKLLVLK